MFISVTNTRSRYPLHREASRSGARAGLDIFMPTNREVCHVSCVSIILYLWTYQLKSGSYLVIFGNICAAAAASGTYLECSVCITVGGGWRPRSCCLLPLHTHILIHSGGLVTAFSFAQVIIKWSVRSPCYALFLPLFPRL